MAMIALSGLLGLPGVTLVNQVTDLETQTVTLQLAHEFDYAVCPECGHISNSLHQNHPVSVRDLDVLGQTCYLQFEKRRFDCDYCGLPFTEQLSFAEGLQRYVTACEPYSRYTTRFEQHVFEVAKEHTIFRAAEVLKLGYRATEGIYYRQAAAYAVRKCAKPSRASGDAECSRVEVLRGRRCADAAHRLCLRQWSTQWSAQVKPFRFHRVPPKPFRFHRVSPV